MEGDVEVVQHSNGLDPGDQGGRGDNAPILA
jgi:hypothetical protein